MVRVVVVVSVAAAVSDGVVSAAIADTAGAGVTFATTVVVFAGVISRCCCHRNFVGWAWC